MPIINYPGSGSAPAPHHKTHEAGGSDVVVGGGGGGIPVTEKGAANGVATLDASALIPTTQLPPLSITSVSVVASEVAMLALTTEEGDAVIRTDISKTYFALNDNPPPKLMTDYQEMLNPGAVVSVNGLTGAVTIDYGDVGADAAGTAQGLITSHNHSGTTNGPKLTQANSHESPDTDSTQASLHHTIEAAAAPQPLGVATAGNATNASASNHVHVMPSSGDVGADATGTAQGLITSHDHSGTTNGPKLSQANSHESPDTDVATSSLHHTLGTGATQAAAGSHVHDLDYLDGTDTPPIDVSGMQLSIQSVPFSIDGEETVLRTYPDPLQASPYYVHQSVYRTPMVYDLGLGEFEGEGNTGLFNAPWVDSASLPGGYPADTNMQVLAIGQRKISGGDEGPIQLKYGSEVSATANIVYSQDGSTSINNQTVSVIGDAIGIRPLTAAVDSVPSQMIACQAFTNSTGVLTKAKAQVWKLNGAFPTVPTLVAQTAEVSFTHWSPPQNIFSTPKNFVLEVGQTGIAAGEQYVIMIEFTYQASSTSYRQKQTSDAPTVGLPAKGYTRRASGVWTETPSSILRCSMTASFSLGLPVRPSVDAGYETVFYVGTPTYPIKDTSNALVIRPWDEVRDDTISDAPGATDVPVASLPKEEVSTVRSDLDAHEAEATLETTITDDDTKYPSSGAVVDYAQPIGAFLTQTITANDQTLTINAETSKVTISAASNYTGLLISAASAVAGQKLRIDYSGANYVDLPPAATTLNNRSLSFRLKTSQWIEYEFDGTNWVEQKRVYNKVSIHNRLSRSYVVGRLEPPILFDIINGTNSDHITEAVQYSLDCGTVALGTFDTVVSSPNPNMTVSLVDGGSGTRASTESITVTAGTDDVVITYSSAVYDPALGGAGSNVSTIEALIEASSPLFVATPGTGSNDLVPASAFAATPLAGGSAMTVTFDNYDLVSMSVSTKSYGKTGSNAGVFVRHTFIAGGSEEVYDQQPSSTAYYGNAVTYSFLVNPGDSLEVFYTYSSLSDARGVVAPGTGLSCDSIL